MFDSTLRCKKGKIILTRRADNDQWCLPSSGVEPGESVTEACIRETLEETGLRVRVKRLTSIFSSPDRLVIYSDGNQFQIITGAPFNDGVDILAYFEVCNIGGKAGLSDETTDIGFYSLPEIESMDILTHHKQFISDILVDLDATIIR